jgi:hypothetical protein
VLSQKNIADEEFLRTQGLLKIDGSLNPYMTVDRYIGLRDKAGNTPPDHLPQPIAAAFTEAATCVAVGCWNAAGAMFRMCVDLATRPLLPKEDLAGLNAKTRRDLGLRLPWLFNNAILPQELRELSACIHQDGNDGAHAGTLTKQDAEDLLDFATALLERMYTEPEKLRLAKERREQRRKASE